MQTEILIHSIFPVETKAAVWVARQQQWLCLTPFLKHILADRTQLQMKQSRPT